MIRQLLSDFLVLGFAGFVGLATVPATASGNENPTARGDTYTARPSTPLDVPAPGFLANDTDPDGDPVTAVLIADPPDSGMLIAFPNGSFTYTPNANFTGTDRFTYGVTDGLGGTDEATVTIRVTNRDPRARSDTFGSRPNTPLNVPAPGFLANDTDADGDPVTATLLVDSVDSGMLVAFPDGSFTYTPNPDFTGTDRFTYRVTDGFGGADEATVTIRLTNRNPRARNDSHTITQDTVLNVPAPGFLANDTDADGDPVTATLLVDSVDSGILVAFPDGSFTYTPNPGFTGTDRFTYRVTDGFGGTRDAKVTIKVRP